LLKAVTTGLRSFPSTPRQPIAQAGSARRGAACPGSPLEADVARLARWIDDGAPYAEPLVADPRRRAIAPWSAPPIASGGRSTAGAVEPPPVKTQAANKNPVDRFVAAKA
jgi:hypothetical protein